jgi:CPA1 family monovalent cation:H+ antiporter
MVAMEIGSAGLLLQLLVLVVIFAVVARRLRVPYPIVMVVAGVVISLIPGLPQIELEPDVIFSVFLPLLLYHAAWHTSWPTMQRNAWSILVLAVGLVVFTVFGIAVAAPAFLPGFDWRTGFLLGAVIAPTDAIAATSVARRMKMRKQLVDIIEGESLVNDATGLLALQLGLTMLLGGRVPTLTESFGRFLYVSAAGVAIGLAVGYLAHRVERWIDDAPTVVASTVLVPFAAYLVAEEVRASGVLAVVACGLLHSRRADESRPPRIRLETGVVWNTLNFILNGLVFVLIGLQLRHVLRDIGGTAGAGALALYALIFALLLIGLRLLWVFPAMALGPFIARRVFHREEHPLPLKSMFLIGWSSMRGVIALAAAMSLPATLPQRPMIIFLAFGAIFISLVFKGLSLPAIIRRLGLSGTSGPEHEEQEARRLVVQQALAHLDALHDEGKVFDEHYDHLRQRYTGRLAALNEESGDEHGTALEHAERYVDVSRALLRAERQAAVRLRNENRVSDEVLRSLLSDLDLAETRLNPRTEE